MLTENEASSRTGFRQIGPDRMEFFEGGGYRVMAGFVIFFPGLMMLIFQWTERATAFTILESRVGYGLLGLVGVLVGAVLMWCPKFTVVDRKKGKVWIDSGPDLRWPPGPRRQSLDLFLRVAIGRDEVKIRKSSVTVFPVRLEGDGDSWTVITTEDYLLSRRTAEALARFLGWDLHDHSTGHPVVRDAGHLDESLKARLARTGEDVAVPTMPPSMRSTVRLGARVLVIRIPPEGFSAVFSVAIVVVVWAFVLVCLISMAHSPEFLVLLPGPIIVGISLWWRIRLRAEIQVEPHRVRVTASGLLPGKRVSLSAPEIEEVFAAPGQQSGRIGSGLPKLVIRTDRRTVEVQGAVSLAEMEYIAALITKRLAQ